MRSLDDHIEEERKSNESENLNVEEVLQDLRDAGEEDQFERED